MSQTDTKNIDKKKNFNLNKVLKESLTFLSSKLYFLKERNQTNILESNSKSFFSKYDFLKREDRTRSIKTRSDEYNWILKKTE